ncbi:secretion-regulating guanine nucleotide exchange factor [Anaeramoeba flamelloides]|uniref:Secretion-regulating guanine nucleotide exchange factor n=1 Tax=Anaeramoeba flamelloides TaxID=1746091 RepID=A0ABQ8YQK0_9EUKA|nr:secretion-regulating guanine nucleotide exchange factor [Anaeramoeba flamelloides]
MNWLVLGEKQFFLDNKRSQVPKTPSKFEDQSINWIASNQRDIFINKPNGELASIGSTGIFKSLEQITYVCSGYYHFLALGVSGKVYSWGKTTGLGCLGHGDNKDLNIPTEIEILTSKNIKRIYCGNYFSLALSENGDLYSFGNNQNADLGNSSQERSISSPTCYHKNVVDVYAGLSWNTFLKYKDGHFTAHGHNSDGSCGIKTGQTAIRTPQTVPFPCKNSEILKISSGLCHSLALNKNGELYGCGDASPIGMSSHYNKFTKHDKFKDIAVKDISCSENSSLIITQEGEVYLGNNMFNKLAYKLEQPLCAIRGNKSGSFFLKIEAKDITNDLVQLRKSGYGADLEICGEKVHSFWLSVRLNSEYNKEMSDFFSTFTNQEFKIFLNWCYQDQGYQTANQLRRVFEKYQINPKTKTIENDLLNLYKDEDSKDIDLLIKMDDDDDEQEEEEFEEIPVHKFILITRCGLFRNMFENIQEETTSIKDFSNKSIDSLEVFVKYLYTDKIELTADNDPELVVEELSDVVEYYQLNENCSFDQELHKIKKQFGLI